MNMDEYVYYWPDHDKYCYRSEVAEFQSLYGDNYSSHLSGEFFATIWVDKED